MVSTTFTSTFLKAVNLILEWEGSEFTNDPDDSGGATKWGVTTEDINPVTKVKFTYKEIVNLSKETAEQVYYNQYWLPVGANTMPSNVATVVFNFAVNTGNNHAVRYLQSITGSYQDGQWGPKTAYDLRGYLEIHGATAFCTKYLDMCLDYYKAIVNNNPSQGKFLQGWLNRTYAVGDAVGIHLD